MRATGYTAYGLIMQELERADSMAALPGIGARRRSRFTRFILSARRSNTRAGCRDSYRAIASLALR